MKKKLYLIATYFKVPRYPKNSSQKGFSKDEANWAFNENVEIARVIKNRDLAQANIILNLIDKKVEKCNMRQDASYDDLHRYFKTNYPQYFQHIDLIDAMESTATEQPTQETAPTTAEPAATT